MKTSDISLEVRDLFNDRSNALIVLLASISLLSVLVFQFLWFAQQKGILPFAYSVQVKTDNGISKFNIKEISQKELKSAFAAFKDIKSFRISASILAFNNHAISVHSNIKDGLDFKVNGHTVKYLNNRFLTPFAVSRGFNYFSVFSNKKVSDLRIIFSRNSFQKEPLSFYQIVQPGTDFSFSKLLSIFTAIIDYSRILFFFSAFLILLLRIGKLLFDEKVSRIPHTPSIFYFCFKALINFLAIIILLLFLFQQFKLQPLVGASILISFAVSSVILYFDLHDRGFSYSVPWKHFLALIFMSLLAFTYVFVVCGRPFPREPISYEGDVIDHLKMIKIFHGTGNFDSENSSYQIYPQSSHAIFAIIVQSINTEPEEAYTLLIIMILIACAFSVYLVGVSLFPNIALEFWLLAMAISSWVYIPRALFIIYSFPSVISTTLFLLSLYFLDKRSSLPASLLLAASLVTYPYFVIPFILGFSFFELGLHDKLDFHGIISIFSKVSPAVFIIGIYVLNYLHLGISQQKQGFKASLLWNPVYSLGYWNAYMFIFGILILLLIKKKKNLLGLVLGTTLGFILYVVFSKSSNYYLMKNANYLIPIGIFIVAFFLDHLLRDRLKMKVFSVFIMIASGILFSISLHKSVKKQPAHPPVGIAKANSWVLEHTKNDEIIAIIATSNYQKTVLYETQTLGRKRALAFFKSESQANDCRCNWLIKENSVFIDPSTKSIWHRVKQCHEIDIFRRLTDN